MEDYIEAHKFSSNHKEQLKKDISCGCFYCLTIFQTTQIRDWIKTDINCDGFETAICPYCGIDSVIGESSGYPITIEFLKKMNTYWF